MRRVRHKKRQSTYEVIGLAEGQVSNGRIVQRDPTGPDDTGFRCSVTLAEGDKIMVYRSEKDGSLWWRVPGEFEDGRFEDIESKPGSTVAIKQLEWHEINTHGGPALSASEWGWEWRIQKLGYNALQIERKQKEAQAEFEARVKSLFVVVEGSTDG